MSEHSGARHRITETRAAGIEETPQGAHSNGSKVGGGEMAITDRQWNNVTEAGSPEPYTTVTMGRSAHFYDGVNEVRNG